MFVAHDCSAPSIHTLYVSFGVISNVYVWNASDGSVANPDLIAVGCGAANQAVYIGLVRQPLVYDEFAPPPSKKSTSVSLHGGPFVHQPGSASPVFGGNFAIAWNTSVWPLPGDHLKNE